MLLTALQETGSLARYVPFDVSDEFLRGAAATLAQEYDSLDIHVVIGDFHQHLAEIPTEGRRMIAFLGGTIGNLNPAQRARFLFDLNCTMSSDDSLLIGTDLVKDRSRLVAAYDDAAGVTADFNRNVLHVLNEQLGGDFDPDRFRHVALWNEDEQWIEMRLRADEASEVSLTGAGITVRFDEGEDLLTEISAKFTPERVEHELSEAGFVVEGMWGARGRRVPPHPGPPFLLIARHVSADGLGHAVRRRLSAASPASGVGIRAPVRAGRRAAHQPDGEQRQQEHDRAEAENAGQQQVARSVVERDHIVPGRDVHLLDEVEVVAPGCPWPCRR